MKQYIISAALTAVSLLTFSTTTLAQTATGTGLKPITTLQCYKNVTATLTEFEEYQFATDGWCQEQCGGQNHPVMAMAGGSTCYCGDTIPPLDQAVASSNCNSPCNGFGSKMCGGIGFYQVYLTGLTGNVQTAPNSTATSSTSSSSAPAVVTKAGETVVVTAGSDSSNKSTSKVGIAVGVVVGLIAVASIVGGVIFFLKQRRRRAIEEEHKRNAAVADFVAGKRSGSTSPSTDQRLDANIFSHRKDSIGSIADEMDYSRRILQVRNPDHRSSTASGLA